MAKARILAVDHQLYFRVFLDELLSEEGYAVETAASAEEALERVERASFDLILTDLSATGEGPELVRELKRRAPDAELVVLTGVSDARVAVEAMKVGATEYLLKPIDRAVLLHALEALLQGRHLREEHATLLAENLEFMGVVSLYERALGLFSCRGLEALADRIVEGLCLETHAHGGVLWAQRPGESGALRLLGARGLVRVADEPEQLEPDTLPSELASLTVPGQGVLALAPEGGGRRALWVPLRERERLLGIARLTDKLDGDEFDETDHAAAHKFGGFAARALAGSLELRELERRSFRDPTTRAYTRAYFDDVARNELRKASRFGRTFSVVRLELDGMPALRTRLSDIELGRWLEQVALGVSRCLRAADLLAVEAEGRFCMLLPETDALGAAILRQRMRETLEQSEPLLGLDTIDRPGVLLASATFPGDGGDLEVLFRALETHISEDRRSPLRELECEGEGFGPLARRLLEHSTPGRAREVEQIARFLLGEVARRRDERGLLFVAPGAGLRALVREELAGLGGRAPSTEIVLLDHEAGAASAGMPVTHASPERAGHPGPFLVWYGEGAPYALLREDAADDAPVYQTDDRALVEQLAFRLGRDLGIPIGAEPRADAGRPA